MVIAFSGGGTLGHIYPALSIINEYKKRFPKVKIIFITTVKDQQYLDKLKNNNIDKIYYIEALGLSKKINKIVKGIYKNILAIKKIKQILQENLVDIVVGMGGYISTLSIYVGIQLKVKTVIHEQNSILGRGNKLVEKKVNLVLLTFDTPKVKNPNKLVVGNPRFKDALSIEENIYRTKNNLLVTSGTLGSKKINDILVEFLNNNESKKYITTLITGKRYYENVTKKINHGNHYEVIPFSNQMINLINKSGIVISRSGATSMFEILGIGVVPIYIPSPNVVSNHQYYNAMEFINKGVGELIEEKNLTCDSLINTINKILNNYEYYQKNIEMLKNTLINNEIILHIHNLVGDQNE